MKLFIIDKSDSTCGIFEQQYIVECPLNLENTPTKDDFDFFKKSMTTVYNNFCGGRVIAYYDFELAEMDMI